MSKEFTQVDWDQYSHTELWNMVIRADPQAMMNTSWRMEHLAGDLRSAADGVHSTLQQLFSGWSGAAADNAASVVKSVLEWADLAADTASDLANRLGRYADVTNEARQAIPAPLNSAATDGKAKQRAVNVMHQYASRTAQIYDGMPAFTQPPTVNGVSFPPPEPEPAFQQPPPPESPANDRPGSSAAATSAESFTVPSTVVGATPAGVGGVLSSVPGAGSATAPVIGFGPGGAAGIGALAEDQLAETAAAQAETRTWSDMSPAARSAARRGERDGEHRSRYTKEEVFNESELPRTCPPVIGA